MTTLVTGAQGGFGRILGAALCADEGEDVVLADRETCDVTDARALHALLERLRPRRVFHLAGSFSGDYETDYRVNARSSLELLESIHALGLETRVMLFGSAAEYGTIRPEDNPIRESHPLHPVTAYGLTKSFQTQIAGYCAEARGSDVVVARVFNLFAPGLSERLFVGRVERLIERYRRGEASTIEVGNLDSRRDYVAADIAVAQIRAIASRGVSGDVYHVASGEAVSMREMLYRMLNAASVPREAVREGVAGAGGRTGYDAPVIYADLSRTRALQASAQ